MQGSCDDFGSDTVPVASGLASRLVLLRFVSASVRLRLGDVPLGREARTPYDSSGRPSGLRSVQPSRAIRSQALLGILKRSTMVRKSIEMSASSLSAGRLLGVRTGDGLALLNTGPDCSVFDAPVFDELRAESWESGCSIDR